MSSFEMAPGAQRILAELSAVARDRVAAIGTAESLTGGLLATHLSCAEDSSGWYRGGLVAYQRLVKHRVLGVPEGPVVSEASARAMAESVREMLGATLACAVTGVGGPEEQDGMPVGTVFLAISSDDGCCDVRRYLFEGDTDEILQQTVVEALTELLAAVE